MANHVTPLYAPAGLLFGDHVRSFWTEGADLCSLLSDALAWGVFDPVGSVTTLEHFVEWRFEEKPIAGLDGYNFRAKILSLVLNGERDRAAALAEDVERGNYFHESKDHVRRWWRFASTDIERVCAELHAREAATVRDLKIEHIWEPSPFPVEVPAAERVSRTAEPAFRTTPWISPPSGLFPDIPERPGQLQFAQGVTRRNGRVCLRRALTSEEAAQRHREGRTYALAARITDGLPIMIEIFASEHLDVWLCGTSCDILGSSERPQAGVTGACLTLILVNEGRRRQSVWRCDVRYDKGEMDIDDDRAGERVGSRIPLTPENRDLLAWSMPAFGAYGDLVERFRSLLRLAGYGEVI